jgi:hypothetical protein
MTIVARAVLKKTDTFPWYEWVDEFEWEDDEFENNRWSEIERQRRAAEQLEIYHRSQTQSRSTDAQEDTRVKGNV